MNALNEFAFGIYPYIAMTVFVVGCIVRFDYAPYTWRAGSSQLMRTKNMRLASNCFHVGILFLFFGHFVGLLTPESVYHHFLSARNKQILAMVSGGIFGVLCLIGIVMLLKRRLTDPRVRITSQASDIAVLVLLLIQLLLGLITIPFSAQHDDASSMIALANWSQHIVTFRPGAAELIAHEALVFKLHIFLGLTLFLLTPFTRLVHVISAPIWYLFRSGYQVVRRRG